MCLEAAGENRCEAPVLILDEAALVNILRLWVARTFDDYATCVFLSYTEKQLQCASRVDIVWDVYVEKASNPKHKPSVH